MSPIAFKITAEFGWGFTSRVIGLSKTSPSFIYPPPTTFLGAISAVLAKEYSLGEQYGKETMLEISRKLLAINLRPLNCMPLRYSDINRIITVKVTSGRLYPKPDDLKRSFDSPACGKTILVSTDKDPPRVEWILVLRDNSINCNGSLIKLNVEHIWRINRIGSKESLVSITEVKYFDNVDIKYERIETKYSFPLSKNIRIITLSGVWEIEQYINPFNLDKWNPLRYYLTGERIMNFYVPVLMGDESRCIVDICGEYCGYQVGDKVVIGKCP